jgi:putative aminopeptidase FrvX
MKEKTQKEFLQTLEKLINIPSPSGYFHEAAAFIRQYLEKFGGEIKQYPHGGIEYRPIPQQNGQQIGFCAHYDTLGLAVRHIGDDGKIRVVQIGGMPWSAVEGEYVQIHTADKKTYSGTILHDKPSTHAYGTVDKDERSSENIWLRLDEKVSSRAEVNQLGIFPGDFISLHPHFVYTESGYIKSRHIDDKAGVCLLLSLISELHENNSFPQNTNLVFAFSPAEEIGKGALFIKGLDELLLVDIGIVGDLHSSREDAVSIVAQDSTGPFDYEFRNRLVNLARQHEIDFELDVFVHYGSDSEAVLKRGENTRTALIGPGTDASHAMERTHINGIKASFQLIHEYIKTLI